MADVQFMFPAVRARCVGPINAATGLNLADAHIVAGQYKHSASHERGGYDELKLDRLSSGNAPAGALAQADGLGGIRFAQVPPLLVVSLGLCGKKVRFGIPTRLAEFSMPLSATTATASTTFSAQLVGKADDAGETADYGWRIYNKKMRTTIVQGERDERKSFSLVNVDESDTFELHVWKTGSETVTVESLRIDTV